MVFNREGIIEEEARYYIHQLLQALDYLHGLSIAHRDIKLSNLLLDSSMNLKLADFGNAAYIPGSIDDGVKSTICGTEQYMSPEVYYKQGHGLKTDLWSVGVVLYPFPITGNEPDDEGSLYCRDLIRRLLTVISDQRLDVLDALDHPPSAL